MPRWRETIVTCYSRPGDNNEFQQHRVILTKEGRLQFPDHDSTLLKRELAEFLLQYAPQTETSHRNKHYWESLCVQLNRLRLNNTPRNGCLEFLCDWRQMVGNRVCTGEFATNIIDNIKSIDTIYPFGIKLYQSMKMKRHRRYLIYDANLPRRQPSKPTVTCIEREWIKFCKIADYLSTNDLSHIKSGRRWELTNHLQAYRNNQP